MVNHYEGHVIFQHVEHQLRENILHHFLHYNFFMKSSINSEVPSIRPTQNYLLEAFATLLNHINYLHPNIEDLTILYFYHNYSGICY